MSQDFLVELGTEELPPKALLSLSKALTAGIEAGLKAEGLSFTTVTPYATPRRLAVTVSELASSTPINDVVDEEGKPSKAAEAFAKKNGIEIGELASENDGKINKLVFRTQAGGVATTDLLAGIVETALAKLPIAKRMRWGASRTEFVRPVHWLVMLYGNDIVDANVLGLQANRQTRGHRFHYNQTLDIASPSEYAQKLKEIGHIVDHCGTSSSRSRSNWWYSRH